MNALTLAAFSFVMMLLGPMASAQQPQQPGAGDSCSRHYQGCSAARANAAGRSVGKNTGVCEKRYEECMATGTYTDANGRQYPGLARQ